MGVKRIELPRRMEKATYAIREIGAIAEELEKKGKDIIYLNSGDPLKHGFDIPQELKEALCSAAKENNRYGNPIGEEGVRKAIAEREKAFNNISIGEDNIVVGNGVSEVFLLAAVALLDDGAEVLVPGPTYPMYKTYVEFMGAKAIEYRCIEEEGWVPDLEDIRKKISNKTVAIVIINPNNPTGAVYRRKTLRGIVDVAAEHGIVVFSDEIYDHNVLEGEFISTSSVTDYPVFGLNGISKSLFATGWRFGYLYLHNPDEESDKVLSAIKKVARMRSYTNMPIQKAVEAVLNLKPTFIAESMKEVKKNRDYVISRIEEIEGISTVRPHGAFYAFPKLEIGMDDKEFTLRLLEEEGVAFVYGSGFGEMGKGHFRIVFLGKDGELEEAMDRLERFIKKNNKF